MILPIQVKVIRGLIKNGCDDLEIKDYIERCVDFNSSFRSKRPRSDHSKSKVRKWIVTIHEE